MLPSVHVYEFYFMDIILGYCFDSQCLSERCPSSTTVDKKSTTGEENAARDSKEPFTLDIYNMYSNAVNVIPDAVNVIPDAVNVIPDAVNVIPDAVNVIPDAVNVIPARYIILQFFEKCFTFYQLTCNAQYYFMLILF